MKSVAGGHGLALVVVTLAALTAGCSKSEEEKRTVIQMPFGQGVPPQRTAEVDSAVAPDEPSSPRLSDLVDATPAPAPVAPAPVASAPKPEDPDQPVLEGARASASQCLAQAPVTASTRTALLTVTVIPNGAVTRAEVTSSDTTEPAVLACIKSVGQGLRFASADGKTPGVTVAAGSLRTYAIDAKVTSGGR